MLSLERPPSRAPGGTAAATDANRKQLESLGEEIAAFAAQVDAATHALLTRLRDFDARDGWALSGAVSCAHWLSWRTGLDLRSARSRVRVARALGTLPATDEALRTGVLSYSKVRALTRVATPDDEGTFIELALHATASQLERLCRAYRQTRHGDCMRPPDRRRFVRRRETDDGMIRLEVQLSPEEAAVVLAAIDSARDAPAQSAPSKSPVAQPMQSDEHHLDADRAEGLIALAESYLGGNLGTGPGALELFLVTSRDHLAGDSKDSASKPGAWLTDGTPLPMQAIRRLACDAALVSIEQAPTGEVLSVGRRTRTIPAHIRRALLLRDDGCRFPGCTHRRHLHGHHVQHWANGGATRLRNLVLVCSQHHRLLHEGGFDVRREAQAFVFRDPKGRILETAPRGSSESRDALDKLDAWLASTGLQFDGCSNEPLWSGDPMVLRETLGSMLNGPGLREREFDDPGDTPRPAPDG